LQTDVELEISKKQAGVFEQGHPTNK